MSVALLHGKFRISNLKIQPLTQPLTRVPTKIDCVRDRTGRNVHLIVLKGRRAIPFATDLSCHAIHRTSASFASMSSVDSTKVKAASMRLIL